MPDSFVAKPRLPLSQLAPGESSYISFADVVVDESDLSAWVPLDAWLRNKSIDTVGVTRGADGYLLVLRDRTLCFRPRRISDRTQLAPVTEIVEELEPSVSERTSKTLQEIEEIQAKLDNLQGAGPRDNAAVAKEPGGTKYQIVLSDRIISVTAATVNLGINKLWFFDSDDHLLAVFRWEEIIGIQVVGSAQEQAFTDDLLHEKRRASLELAELESQRGTFLATALTLHQTLEKTGKDATSAWVKLYESRKKTSEMALLVERHAGEVRQLEAQITDDRQSLEKTINMILSEFKELFPNKKK